MEGRLNIWNALPVRMLDQSTEYFRKYAARWTDEDDILWEVTVASYALFSYRVGAFWECEIFATRNGARLRVYNSRTLCAHDKLYKALECAREKLTLGVDDLPTRVVRYSGDHPLWNAAVLGRFYGLTQGQVSTFEALAPGWTLSTGELVDAVRAIVPELEVSR